MLAAMPAQLQPQVRGSRQWPVRSEDAGTAHWVACRSDEMHKFQELEKICSELDIILSFIQSLEMFIDARGPRCGPRLPVSR